MSNTKGVNAWIHCQHAGVDGFKGEIYNPSRGSHDSFNCYNPEVAARSKDGVLKLSDVSVIVGVDQELSKVQLFGNGDTSNSEVREVLNRTCALCPHHKER